MGQFDLSMSLQVESTAAEGLLSPGATPVGSPGASLPGSPGGAATGKGRRRRKQKKEVIVISLWVNQVKYEHGCCKFNSVVLFVATDV